MTLVSALLFFCAFKTFFLASMAYLIFTSILSIFVFEILLILYLTNFMLSKSKYGKSYFHAKEDDDDEGDGDEY